MGGLFGLRSQQEGGGWKESVEGVHMIEVLMYVDMYENRMMKLI
jgi:hypothetical protein